MKLYRFSPIKNKTGLKKSIIYVTKQAKDLSEKILGKQFSVKAVTIFAHYPKEYEQLSVLLLGLGKLHSENNGPRVILTKPIRAGSDIISVVRIRKPDPYRSQAGCVDFSIENYFQFKKKYLKNGFV